MTEAISTTNTIDTAQPRYGIPAVPHLEQYLGVWAMHQPMFATMTRHVGAMDLSAHIAAHGSDRATNRKLFVEENGVAIIDMIGVFTKFGSSFSSNPGTLSLRRSVRAAAADESIHAIALRIDSPGGAVAGTDDLAADIAAATQVKPVHAFIEDLGASGAFWIASQATRVFANRSAQIGSIGVYGVIRDFSGAFKDQGIKTHVIRSGPFKGVGEHGAPVTDEQLAELQKMVDAIHNLFVGAVAKGRGMDREAVAAIADGGVHLAAAARKIGLIDAVETFDGVLNGLSDRPIPRAAVEGDSTMGATKTEEGSEPVVTTDLEPLKTGATVAELKRACPGSDAEFREQMIELGATTAQATEFWNEELGKRNAVKAAELAAREKQVAADAEALKAKAPAVSGVDPLPTGKGSTAAGGESGDAVQRWNEAVKEKKASGMDNARAVGAVVREDPELHRAYLAAYNAAHGRPVLV